MPNSTAISSTKDSEHDWDALRASMNEHAALIGQVTIGWNMCQLLVFSLFYAMSRMTWADAQAVFFAIKSDGQQRDITTALATAHLTGARNPRKKVVAAIGRLNELAGERNAATHTMWAVDTELGSLRPADVLHNPRLKIADPQLQFAQLDTKLTSAHGALLKACFAVMKYETSLRSKSSA